MKLKPATTKRLPFSVRMPISLLYWSTQYNMDSMLWRNISKFLHMFLTQHNLSTQKYVRCWRQPATNFTASAQKLMWGWLVAAVKGSAWTKGGRPGRHLVTDCLLLASLFQQSSAADHVTSFECGLCRFGSCCTTLEMCLSRSKRWHGCRLKLWYVN